MAEKNTAANFRSSGKEEVTINRERAFYANIKEGSLRKTHKEKGFLADDLIFNVENCETSPDSKVTLLPLNLLIGL